MPSMRMIPSGLLALVVVSMASLAPGQSPSVSGLNPQPTSAIQTLVDHSIPVRVVDSTGKPIRGARISCVGGRPARSRWDWSVVAEKVLPESQKTAAISNDTGESRLQLALPSSASFCELHAQISADGFVPRLFSAIVALSAGSTVVQIVLQPVATLSGSVVDARGMGEARAQVWLYGDLDARRNHPSHAGITDEQGRFHLKELVPGAYRVVAITPDGRQCTRRVGLEPGDKAANLRLVVPHSEDPLLFRGRVVGQDDRGVALAGIKIEKAAEPRRPAVYLWSNQEGHFAAVVEKASADIISIESAAGAHGSVSRPQLTIHERSTEPILMYVQDWGRLACEFSDNRGEPLTRVSVRDWDQQPVLYEDHALWLPPYLTEISVAAPGIVTRTVSVDFREKEALQLTLQASTVLLTGQVLQQAFASEELLIAAVPVCPIGDLPRPIAPELVVRPDADGSFCLPVPKSGTYLLLAIGNECVLHTQQVTVGPEGLSGVQLPAQAAATVLHGTVFGTEETLELELWVALARDGYLVQSCRADGERRYQFDGLDPGLYSLAVLDHDPREGPKAWFECSERVRFPAESLSLAPGSRTEWNLECLGLRTIRVEFDSEHAAGSVEWDGWVSARKVNRSADAPFHPGPNPDPEHYHADALIAGDLRSAWFRVPLSWQSMLAIEHLGPGYALRWTTNGLGSQLRSSMSLNWAGGPLRLYLPSSTNVRDCKYSGPVCDGWSSDLFLGLDHYRGSQLEWLPYGEWGLEDDSETSVITEDLRATSPQCQFRHHSGTSEIQL